MGIRLKNTIDTNQQLVIIFKHNTIIKFMK